MSEDRLSFREAREEDLRAILDLLADDPLGKTPKAPDGPLDVKLVEAFRAIAADPNQYLLVGELEGQLCCYLQLSVIPGLTKKGAWRAHIEAVRVASQHRGKGIGRALFGRAFDLARERNCALVQLMMDQRRSGSRLFYEALGFKANHLGLRRALTDSD